MKIIASGIALAASLIMGPALAESADEFPSKSIRIVVPFSPGGGSDDSSRFNADELHKVLKVPVVVENRPGASGLIAVGAVKNSPADGYTVLMATNSLIAVNPVTMKNLPYDPFKDLRPVHGGAGTGALITANVDSGFNTLQDAIDAVKKDKRQLMVGTYSEGYELLVRWLGKEANVEVVNVPYKGPANAITDLIGGRLDLMISDAASPFELIRSDKLRGLAITSDQRDAKLPEVPTMKESGYPEFESYVWSSYYVLADTPDDITRKLADAFRVALNSEASDARRDRLPGFIINYALDEMGDFQRKEYERFKMVVTQTGYRKD